MMATSFEWFQTKVLNLSNDLERSQVLSEIKIAFSALNSSQQKYIAQNLQLDVVFDCLNCSEREQIELTCHILSMVLCSLDSGTVIGQYGTALQRALRHPTIEVKKLSIAELQRAASDEDLIPHLCEGDLLSTVVTCVCHENLSVAKCAASVLSKLGESAAGLLVLFTRPILDSLKDAQQQSDVIRFRVYEIIVDISANSLAGLETSHSCGFLSALIAELKTDDVLLHLNALELLTKLALSSNGLQYLEEHGVLKFLANKVEAISDEPLASIVLPGLIKFFGNVAQSHPKEIFGEYPNMVAALFETFDSTDLIVLGVAMETIGYIGTTVEGKYMLQSLNSGNTMTDTMKNLAHKINSLPTEWRVRTLNTVANLVELKIADQDTQSLAVTKGWFDHLSPNPMETIMSVCRQPFPELRLAGLQVLQALAQQVWGQEYLNNFPGLVEFLLDRTMESNKPCKDAKYDIVQTIVDSPTAASTFGNETFRRLLEFSREGPFYVLAHTEVAIEGAS